MEPITPMKNKQINGIKALPGMAWEGFYTLKKDGDYE